MIWTMIDEKEFYNRSVEAYHMTLHSLINAGWSDDLIEALIAKPVDLKSQPIMTYGRWYPNEPFGAQRSHKAGHGWKANHQN